MAIRLMRGRIRLKEPLSLAAAPSGSWPRSFPFGGAATNDCIKIFQLGLQPGDSVLSSVLVYWGKNPR